MKQAFLVIIFMWLTRLNIGAQIPVVKAGEGNSLFDMIPTRLIGETDSNYVALSYVYGTTLSSVLKNNRDRIGNLRILFVDKSSMKVKKELKFPVFTNESGLNFSETDVIQMNLTSDTLGVFTRVKDKENNTVSVHFWQFNVNTLDPSTSKVKFIGHFESNGQFIYKEFKALNRIMIVKSVSSSSSQETRVQYVILDRNNKVVKHDKFTLRELKRKYVKLADIIIDNEDNVYLVHKITAIKSMFSFQQDWEMETNFRLAIKLKSGRSVKSSIITLSDGKPVSSALALGGGGDVFVIGNYSGIKNINTFKTSFNGGSFISKVTKKDAKVVQLDQKQLSTNHTLMLKAKSRTLQSGKVYHREMIAMEIEKVFSDSLGNTTTVSHSNYIRSVRSGNNGSYVDYFYANSFIVTKYTSQGSIAWQMVVPRNSVSKGASFASQPIIQFNKGFTYIIFNDNAKNIFSTNNMALDVDIIKPKEKLFRRGNSKLFYVEPVDLPPSNSDDFHTLNTWNYAVANTRARVTTISGDGKWTVHWPKAELEKGKKNVFLSNDIQFVDKEGNIITLIFNDYNAYFMKQSAFTKVTFP